MEKPQSPEEILETTMRAGLIARQGAAAKDPKFLEAFVRQMMWKNEDGSNYFIDAVKEGQRQAVRYALSVAAEKVVTKQQFMPSCDDHTPYWGACVSCGRYDNPDVLIGEAVDKESITSSETEIFKNLGL